MFMQPLAVLKRHKAGPKYMNQIPTDRQENKGGIHGEDKRYSTGDCHSGSDAIQDIQPRVRQLLIDAESKEGALHAIGRVC
jgi:hypothetical protein